MTVLDLISEVFEEDLGPDLINSISTVPKEKIEDFAERYLEYAAAAQVPTKQISELRPFIVIDHRIPFHSSDDPRRKPAHGLQLSYVSGFDTPDLEGVQAQVLSHHLLYCHSIAISNPLHLILDVVPWGLLTDTRRHMLQNCLIFLSHIRPLIESGIVVLVENEYAHEAIRNRGDWPRGFLDYAATKEFSETADFSDFMRARPQDISDKLVRLLEAQYMINSTLVANAMHTGALDLYLPYQFYVDLLRKLVTDHEHRALVRGQQIKQHELTVHASVMSLKLPQIGRLSVEDIVKIRMNEEVFEHWRQTLARGIERIAGSDTNYIDVESELSQSLRKEFLHEEHRINQELSKNSFLSLFKQAARRFTVGAVATAAVAPSLKAGLSGGAISSAADLLISYVMARRTNFKDVISRHFAVFSPPDDV